MPALLKRFHSDLLAKEHYLLVLQITAIFFLFRGYSGAALWEVVLEFFCIAMLLSMSLLQRSAIWLLMFAIGIIFLTLDRGGIDNHKYLMTYWVLALGLCLDEPNREKLIAFNGRLLIGLVFGFATFWKFYTGEFTDGSFFYWTYLEDSRFHPMAQIVGAVPLESLHLNFDLLRIFNLFPGPDMKLVAASSPRMPAVAFATSYWTLLIEGLIALLFLLSSWKRLEGLRDIVLLAFAVTTYPIAPVDRFGILIVILGFAQCPKDWPRLRIAYVYVFLFLQFTRASDVYNRLLLFTFG